MASANNVRQLGEAIAAAAVTAALFYFGNGLEPRWWLVWLAPLPLLVFALRSSWWAAGLAAVVAMLVGNLNMWSYFTKTLGMPAVAWMQIYIVAGIFFALGVLLFRALALRGAVWSALVALPAMWTTMEYVRNLTTPHGSAGSLAYSQLQFLPFLQVASLTGPWGMTFLLVLFPSALALGWHLRMKDRTQAAYVVGAGMGVIALALIFGSARLAMPEKQTARVGLITSDVQGNLLVTDPGADTERLFRDYASTARALVAQGAQAIVIPEKLGVTLEGKSAETDAVMQSLAMQTGATVVAGVVHVDAPVKYNEARVYQPSSSAIERYDKEHMLPPFESNLKPGTELVLLPKKDQLWGVAICKDMDFRDPARRYGKAGAGLMLVPGWDFVVDAGWHGHIAVMRGVEDGFSIARAAKTGYLTVSDDRGRIIGEVRSNAAPFATLLVDVPSTHHATLYQLMGDWFAWLSIAVQTFAVVRVMLPGSRA
ncbi:apolipoprotein N-acyltransferase [Edaphobacter flagellatus]|uniref:apolipoprotein N-acyltransferase n=1 Tax=Edaphobacter flagellatus TaxID=1933044 RepID=UPI0021B21545|nr:nitrilase-related carbon-nitrogen hydrolase [Edaphobacter flagellatus]